MDVTNGTIIASTNKITMTAEMRWFFFLLFRFSMANSFFSFAVSGHRTKRYAGFRNPFAYHLIIYEIVVFGKLYSFFSSILCFHLLYWKAAVAGITSAEAGNGHRQPLLAHAGMPGEP